MNKNPVANGTRLPVIGISRLRIDQDGPGVRTLIATFACPLRCKYCLNPHSWDGSGKIRGYTPEELFQAVAKDDLYFRSSGGGITLGGGEPLLHIAAIEEFRQLCPDAWNFRAETSLQVPRDTVIRAAKVFDSFAVDLKTTDPAVYEAYTGKPQGDLMEKLLLLQSLVGTERIQIRLPLIPGYVDETLREQSRSLLENLVFPDIELFTYLTEIHRK